MDEKYGALQHEYRLLNDLLDKVRREKETSRDEFDQNINNLNDRITELKNELQRTRTSAEESALVSSAELQRLRDELASRELESRNSLNEFVETFSNLQVEVNKVMKSCTFAAKDFEVVSQDIKEITSQTEYARGEAARTVSEAHNQVKRALDLASSRLKTSERETTEARDDMAVAELERDELKGSIMMEQERSARLQHEIRNLKELMENASKHTEDRVRAANAEATAATNVRLELDAKLQTKISDLTQANRLVSSLQVKCEELSSRLSSVEKEKGITIRELEVKMEELMREKAALSNSVETSQGEVGVARQGMTALKGRIRQLEQERENSSSRLRQREVAVAKQSNIITARLNASREEISNLHAQLDRTRTLYTHVKEARDTLQSENLKLRQELANERGESRS